MVETLESTGSGTISTGTGGTIRRGGSRGTNTAVEDEHYADRLNLVRMASGDGLLFNFDPNVWLDLIYSEIYIPSPPFALIKSSILTIDIHDERNITVETPPPIL